MPSSAHPIPSPMAIWLALDIGERRIGMATGSDDARLARPLGIINRRVKREEFAAVARIAAENRADHLLVGLPYNMDGSEGPQAKRIRNYVRLMERAVPLPVHFWDERLSSFAADEIISELGRHRHPHNDAIAAATILQSFFDARATTA